VGIENPIHLLFIAAVALIVLGPKRLPALARALGQAVREFRASLEEGSRTELESDTAPAADSPGEPLAGSVQAPEQGASDESR
jgi:sec-independent protein translocase protein TatA